MVTRHFHFNGFLPNMLYFFIIFLIIFRRLYLVTPTFIIEPQNDLECHLNRSVFCWITKTTGGVRVDYY